MLARFAKEAEKFPRGAGRITFMWGCAKLAFDRSKEPEERKWWRRYMDLCNRSLERYRREQQKRDER
jgi:hypothetical protein